MRPTVVRLSKGFWGRSLDELKRYTNIIINLEAIKGPSGPYILTDFHDPETASSCKVMSDDEIGGFSTSNLTWEPFTSRSDATFAVDTPTLKSAQVPYEEAPQPPSPTQPGYARFHGAISTELPRHRPEIQRTGYAAFRTPDRGRTIFGKGLWDIDPWTFLAMRIKSDGRSYFVNIQTESVVPTDLHQHRLFAKRPGEWETVLINWNEFVRTSYGHVVEPQSEILRQRVRSIGIGLTDRVPGPFELCVERIWATNDESLGGEGAAAGGTGDLRNRLGENVKWGQERTRREKTRSDRQR